jgi:multiple sugar transport system substrate-binding protein
LSVNQPPSKVNGTTEHQMTANKPSVSYFQKAMLKYLALTMIIVLVGCTTPTPVVPPTLPEATLPPTVEISFPTEETGTPQSTPITIKLWIPPKFDPSNGTPEGNLLQERLEEFTQRRENVRIETRAKNVDGPGGMIDTLATAAAAAPLAMPDLVALPNHSLENAAIKGLLHSFDGLTTVMDGLDWFNFARTLSHIKNSTFGIPFAADALILVYRPSVLGSPPSDWTTVVETSTESTAKLSFPAGDPKSLVTLLMYLSTGGAVLDEENRPTLDPIKLIEVLTYYDQARQSSLISYLLTPYETDDQSWAAYEDKQSEMVITWASRYLKNPPADSAGAPIPTPYGIPYTLATGWAWALASTDPDRQVISTQLAEFLTTGDFLAEWTALSGYIPPRPSAQAAWNNVSMINLLNGVTPSAQLIPSLDVLTALGPILQGATVDVLKEQADPATAAETAIKKLVSP